MTGFRKVRRTAAALLFAVLLVAFCLSSVGAAERIEGTAGDTMFDRYLAERTARLSECFLDGATNLGEWQARRARLRQEYLDMLGLWPLPERTALHAKMTGTVERDDVVIEKLHFQSRPGLYVTANLYRPRQVVGKLPAVLYLCGHFAWTSRDGAKSYAQDRLMWYARNGYLALAIDTMELSEVQNRYAFHHGTALQNRLWWWAAGFTPAGVECWNGIRALDYLLSRPEVDPERIAVTGISGGGAYTVFVAAADERVRCAVPVSGMSDLESYVSHKTINFHCDCIVLQNTYGWEWTTIAALIAPRPLLFCNSDQDETFPMDGNRRIMSRLRQVYQMYGKPELVDQYVSHGGHAYRADLRVAIFGWINSHLKQDQRPPRDTEWQPIASKHLRVFPEEVDLPGDAINSVVDEVFVPQANVRLPEPEAFASWKNQLVKSLRARSFRMLPERVAAARPVRPANPGEKVEVLGAEPGIEVTLTQVSAAQDDHRQGTLIVLNADETVEDCWRWAQPYATHGVVFALEPRGVGATAWSAHPSHPRKHYYVQRAHVLLGQTVDEGRVRDIAATLAYLKTRDGRHWTLAGKGPAGILGVYAALLDQAADQVVVVDPPHSHRQGPIFLNILQVLDIPEALGLLAPKPLVLVDARDKVFDRVEAIFRLAGAPAHCQRQ
jgi:dienelactone hydrolase